MPLAQVFSQIGGAAIQNEGAASASRSQNRAAQAAIDAAAFAPFNVNAQGIGSATFGPNPDTIQGQQGPQQKGLFEDTFGFSSGIGSPGEALAFAVNPFSGFNFASEGISNALSPSFGDAPVSRGPRLPGENENLNIRLDPAMEAFRQQFLQGAQTNNPLFGQTAGLFGQAGQNFMGLGGQTQGIGQNVLGVGQGTLGTGADLFGRGGSFLNQGQNMFGQGQSLIGRGENLLGQALQQDPTQIAQQQFDRLNALIEPGQQRARSSLENRLFAQGRLGASGGAQQFQDLVTAQGQQTNQLAAQSLEQGQQVQQQQFNQAQGVFNQGLNTIGTGVGVGSLGNNLFTQGQGLLGLGTQQFGQGADLLSQGAGQFERGAGLFGQQTAIQDQQFASQLDRLNAARTLAQDPLQLANLGVAIGGRQSAAGASVAPIIAQAGQNNPQASLLGGLGQGLINNAERFRPNPVRQAAPIEIPSPF